MRKLVKDVLQNNNYSINTIIVRVMKMYKLKMLYPANEVGDKSAFILDDTTHAKTGRRIEQMTKVFDHVAEKKNSK